MQAKRLELLSELVPQAGVIALLVDPNNVSSERRILDMQEAARAKGVKLPILKASTESEIDAAFAALIELHAGGLVVRVLGYQSSRKGPIENRPPQPVGSQRASDRLSHGGRHGRKLTVNFSSHSLLFSGRTQRKGHILYVFT